MYFTLFTHITFTVVFDFFGQEIAAAIESKCNIVPVLDNFKWPKPEQLPDDMKNIIFFNGIK